MTRLPSRMSRLFRLFGELGNAEGRRRTNAKGSQPCSLGELLEARQLLAADLTKVMYDATLLDQHESTTTVDSYFVAFNKTVSATTIKNATGASSVKPFALIPNSFDLKFDVGMSFQEAGDSFSKISGFKYLYPNLPLDRTVKFIPNDPLFVSQWHLQNTGQTGGTAGIDANVTSAWDTVTGAGTVIGVVDDGVQLSHPDLAANVAAGLSFDFVDGDADPTPAANSGDFHGTAVAGVAAAVGNNGVGVTGVAYEASIAGIRLLGFPQTAGSEAAALSHRTQQIDIYNNSWGPNDIPIIAALPPQVEAALSAGTRLGRGGLGAIYTWAGGNGRGNGDYSNYDQYASSRHVIAVGAITHNGVQSSYSESGSNLLVSAYSSSPGIVTTDIVGADGYDSTDYTNTFGGTSSATPLVSGVIALMLEANPNLSYRDVMDVLARTAERNDPTDSGWSQNGAGLWINHKYGFGAVDAAAAVSASATHNALAPLVNQSTPVVQVNRTIPDNSTTGVLASVVTNIQVNLEHVELVLNATHDRRGDLAVTLVSPNGTRSEMALARTLDTGDDYTNWVFTTTRNWGERSNGTWTVEVADLRAGTTGTLDDVQLRFYGTALPLSLSVSPESVLENAGAAAAIGTVTRSSASSLAQPLVVTLTSNDTSEATVPATVTIPAGATSATFPIRAIDDTLADGTQRVDIQASATIGGTLTTVAAGLDVLDHETLTMSISKTTFAEDAGAGAAQVTITRSNTDTAAPNTFSVVNNRLLEHNAAGTQVSSRAIPWPTGVRPAGEIARDLVVMENGRVAVYNGTTTGYLSIFNQTTNLWQHIAVPGLTSDAAVAGSGGISSTGNFVFLADMSSSTSDPYGVVRVDTTTGATTRFANQSLGYRIFVKDIFADNIIEIDLKTGATINTIPMPPLSSNHGFNNGLAFDGTNLWVLAGPTNNNLVYKLDANTGTVLETHAITGAGEWDGLAWLNDQLYLLNNFVENQITVYDPVQRRVTDTLNVGAINNINITGGLAAITGPDRLIVTSTFGDIVYEINPVSGVVTNEWRSGMSTTEYGVGVANGEIYIGEFIGGSLRIFNRAGVFQRTLDVDLSGSEGVFAIGGDDIKTLVPTDFRYRDIYSGLDDKFYVLDKDGTDIGRFNPATLALEEFFKLSRPVNAISVAADGTVWGAGGDGILYHFDETGAVIGQRTIGSVTLVDIDLNVTGQILVTSSAGRVYRTSTSLVTPTSFSAGSTVAYASLGRHQSLPAGDLIVNLTNSDPTEVSLPATVVIPVGQRSVTIPLNAVDDKILDGPQTVTITASANGYTGTLSRTITVTDAESIAIDILATEISEAAGKNATQARLTRSNTEGPFTHLSKQSFRNTTARTILDFDKTLSQITVPSQTSQLIDVNVTLSLFHSFLADLDIFLVSPNGTRVELVTDIVSNEPNMTGTTFDDNANDLILDGDTPFTGRFRPEGSLLALNGENPTGRWTLEITDDNQTDFGTLLSWSLDIETMGLAPLTVTLTPTGDTNEISAPRTVVIPANQTSVLVPIDAVDDTLLDGTRTSGLRTSTTTAGYVTGSDTVRVTDSESLTFSVNRTTVSEAAGNGAVTGTITRSNTDISSSFTVNVFSNDPTELSVPATVTIPAGAKSVTFPINAVDDDIHDGSQTVTIRVSAAAYGADKSRVITVTDLEPSLKVSASKTTVREDAGTIQVTVTRQDQSDLSKSMAVNLAVINVSQGTSPLTVPAVVTIPANRSSVTFNVTVNNDNLLDGTQTATIRARGTGITEGSAVFTVTDHETLSLTFEDTTLREDNGAKATRGTIRRSNINIALPLVVTLTSSDTSELKVPSKVTIPAGSSSVSFDVDTVNDSVIDGTQSVTITAVATGYVNGTGKITVADHEPPVLTGPAASVTTSKPAITWKAVTGALRYDVLLRNMSSGIEQLYPGITKTTFTRTEPLGIGRYRVYVRAIDQLERAGFWSSLRDFKVETAPKITAPVIKPQVGSTFPEISWTAVIDAAGYELVVHNATTGTKNVISEKNLKTTSFRSTQSLGSGTYTAYVRAFNAKKEFGKWTPAYSFTVLGTPTMLTPVSGGTFDRIPLISWTAVAGATSYDVHLSNRTTGEIVFRDQHVTGTSVRVPRDLADGEYRLGVQAQFGSFYGNWPTARYFSVGTSPVTTSPKTGAHAGAKPKFVWTAISGAERYELHVRNLDTNAVVLLKTDITTTSYTMTSSLPLANYRVYVRAVSTMGEFTAWNKRVDFIGGATPKITSPAVNAKVAAKPTMAWSEVSGAVSYQVWVRDQETMKWVVKASNIKTNSYTLKTSLDSGKYRVWVRAVSAKGHVSAWSTGVDFRVSSSEQTTPSQDASVNGLLASVLYSADEEQQNSHVEVSDPGTQSTVSVTVAEATSSATESEAPVGHQELDAVMAGWDASEWWLAGQTPVADVGLAASVKAAVPGEKSRKI